MKKAGVLVIAAVCAGAVYLLAASHGANIMQALVELAAAVAAMGLVSCWLTAARAVPEPNRVLIYRLGRFHRLAGPGYVFVVPRFERIEATLDMSPHVLAIDVPRVRGADGRPIRANLEVTWRIDPRMRGRVPSILHRVLLMDDKSRARLVEETAIMAARQVISGYTMADLSPTMARESATATITEAANAALEGYGLRIERVFWSGAAYPAALSDAKLEGVVRLREVEQLIAAVEAIKRRLPDMSADEMDDLSAWVAQVGASQASPSAAVASAPELGETSRQGPPSASHAGPGEIAAGRTLAPETMPAGSPQPFLSGHAGHDSKDSWLLPSAAGSGAALSTPPGEPGPAADVSAASEMTGEALTAPSDAMPAPLDPTEMRPSAGTNRAAGTEIAGGMVSADIGSAEGPLGSALGSAVGAIVGSAVSAPREQSATVSSPIPTQHGAASAIPVRDARFTAFHPARIEPEAWFTLLVYAHLAEAVDAVRTDAATFGQEMGDGQQQTQSAGVASLAEGTVITIEPESDDLAFVPTSSPLTWRGRWQRATFRFQRLTTLPTKRIAVRITVRVEPLIVATIELSMLTTELPTPPAAEHAIREVTVKPYGRIFASYSHDDTAVVAACRAVQRAFGQEVLVDYDALRAGQYYDNSLLYMIDQADIFELFWSRHAAKSPYVRREWKYAVRTTKGEGFIRPVYWQHPLVRPPRELAHLHFAFLDVPALRLPVSRAAGGQRSEAPSEPRGLARFLRFFVRG